MTDTEKDALVDDFDAVTKVAQAEPDTPAGDGGGAPADTGSPAPAGTASSLSRPPSDDPQWIIDVTMLGQRAEQLRAQMLQKLGPDRGEMNQKLFAASRAEKMADTGLAEANKDVTAARNQTDTLRQQAADIEKQADDAELNNDVARGKELREEAAINRAAADRAEAEGKVYEATAADLKKQIATHKAEREALTKRLDEQKADILAAENEIDAIEAKEGHLWETDHYRTQAVTLEREAAELRAQGKTAEADAKQAEVAKATAAAETAAKAAEAVVVDEAVLAKAGLDVPPAGGQQAPAPATDETPAPSSPDGSETTDGTQPAGDATGEGTAAPADAPADAAAPTGAAAAQARAEALRAELTRKVGDDELSRRRDDLNQDKQTAAAAAKAADADAARREANQDRYSKQADKAEREAAALERQGKTAQAEERREEAGNLRAAATRDAELAARAKQTAEQHRAEVTQVDGQLETVNREWTEQQAKLDQAEKAVDALEDQARQLTQADVHEAKAAQLQRDAEAARDEGKVAAAYSKERQAEQEIEAADQARAQAAAIKVDETALSDAGLADAGSAAPAPAPAVDPTSPSAILDAQADKLRVELLQKISVDRATDANALAEARRAETVAEKAVETVEAEAKQARADETHKREQADKYDGWAAEAEKSGDAQAARDYRQMADVERAEATRVQFVAERAEDAAAAARKDLTAKTEDRTAKLEQYKKGEEAMVAARNAIEGMETRAGYLKEAEGHQARAAQLQAESQTLRAQGNDAAANVRDRQATRASEEAASAQRNAELIKVDEAAIKAIGLDPVPGTPATQQPTTEQQPGDEQPTTEQQPAAPPDATSTEQPADGPAEQGEPGAAADELDDMVVPGGGGEAVAQEADVDVTGASQVAAAADESTAAAAPDSAAANGAGGSEVAAPPAGVADSDGAPSFEQEQDRAAFEPAPSFEQPPAFEQETGFDSEPAAEDAATVAADDAPTDDGAAV